MTTEVANIEGYPVGLFFLNFTSCIIHALAI